MGIYERYVLPQMLNCACGTKPIRYQRKKVVPEATGRVLEIGMGTGLNLPYYDKDKIDFVWGLEPSLGMRTKAVPNVEASGIEVKWLDLPGEEIPLDDNSVDTVVLTFTLCTIPDGLKALEQMRRVLKPGGRMVFAEHGEAPDAKVQRMQNRLNGVWGKVFGGCNINRPITKMIETSGFKVGEVETMYLPGTPRFVGYNYWGWAEQR